MLELTSSIIREIRFCAALRLPSMDTSRSEETSAEWPRHSFESWAAVAVELFLNANVTPPSHVPPTVQEPSSRKEKWVRHGYVVVVRNIDTQRVCVCILRPAFRSPIGAQDVLS